MTRPAGRHPRAAGAWKALVAAGAVVLVGAAAFFIRGGFSSPAPMPSTCLGYHADMLYTEAERCYTAIIEEQADDWRWWYYRALIVADRGGGDRLIADLRRVTEANPSFSPAWLRLGDAEFKAGRYDAASVAWARVLDLPEPERPARTTAHYVEVPAAAYATVGLARVALARGEADAARRQLEPLIAGQPGFSSGFRVLAEAYSNLGREQDAQRATYRAGRLPSYAAYADPMVDELAERSRNATFLLRLASEADLSINGAWAEYLTRRGLELEPDNPDIISKLGRILRTVGRSEEALVYFRRYQDLVPGDYQGLGHLGGALADLGRFDEAEPYFRRALEGTDDAVTHYNLALLLATTGRLDEAAASYRRALERNPADANARINLATVFARQGRMAAAVAELQRVVAADPENELARANLRILTGR